MVELDKAKTGFNFSVIRGRELGKEERDRLREKGIEFDMKAIYYVGYVTELFDIDMLDKKMFNDILDEMVDEPTEGELIAMRILGMKYTKENLTKLRKISNTPKTDSNLDKIFKKESEGK